jgi:hypothetical protein
MRFLFRLHSENGISAPGNGVGRDNVAMAILLDALSSSARLPSGRCSRTSQRSPSLLSLCGGLLAQTQRSAPSCRAMPNTRSGSGIACCREYGRTPLP